MTSDQEPRYRLVDSNGNIVGSLYGKTDGSIAIQETDSGADREVALAPDGTFSAPSVETESVSTDNLNDTPATVTWGDLTETDIVFVQSLTDAVQTVDSQEFDLLGNTSLRPLLDISNFDLTNTKFVAQCNFRVLSITDGEELTVQVVNSPNTSVSTTSTGNLQGPIGDLGTVFPSSLEAEITGGSADVDRATLVVGREING